MNEYHSRTKWKYKNRWIAEKLRDASNQHPVVVISGARQVGKSTLLQNEEPFKNWTYVTLDDYDALEQAQVSPESLWANTSKLIIDEVQKAPSLLPAIKSAVDKSKRKLRFILSGSANLLLMQKVSESLAGRAVYFTLYPMTIGEATEAGVDNIIDSIFKGRIPKTRTLSKSVQPEKEILKGQLPLLRAYRNSGRLGWLDGYIATYLERDLRQLSQVESLPDFRRVMEAIALRSGNIINQSEVSRDTRVSQPTIHRYINLLETNSLLGRLPAFANNRTKRLIKSPKFYWTDSSLAAYLCGYYELESLKNSREIGSLFEGLVLLHLRVLSELMSPVPRLYYWRTVTGHEVDFVIEHGKRLLAIEVKLKRNLKFSDTENLRIFVEDYPQTILALVVYSGKEIKYLAQNILAIPWQIMAGLSLV